MAVAVPGGVSVVSFIIALYSIALVIMPSARMAGIIMVSIFSVITLVCIIIMIANIELLKESVLASRRYNTLKRARDEYYKKQKENANKENENRNISSETDEDTLLILLSEGKTIVEKYLNAFKQKEAVTYTLLIKYTYVLCRYKHNRSGVAINPF